MKTRLLLHPIAELEIAGARNWYRIQSPQITARFVADLDDVLTQIEAFPQRFPIVYQVESHEVRRARLKAFAYTISYVSLETIDPEADEQILILKIVALRHDRQRAFDWGQRLN